jgi:predicted small lipoprotein YifL
MLRAAVAAAMLATAYCGAKGPPQPPVREAPDAGSTSSTSDEGGSARGATTYSPAPALEPGRQTSTPDSGSESPGTRGDAGPP